MTGALSVTVAELAAAPRNALPDMFQPAKHLVCSTPATLAFNSPGAQGFGVKRAGLAVPGSVMLLVAPRCCGRNTTALGNDEKYADRFYYLLMDDNDIVTGRHLNRIPEAVCEICRDRKEKPSAVMICITCVDALLGTDMERVCRKCSAAAGVPVEPCYMYALTREGRLPPMASVRKSIYNLLAERPKRADSANILGFFSPLQEDCELIPLLQKAGVRQVRELSRCRDFAEYQQMAEANFNLVLHQEARYAAQDLQKRLQIPFIELTRRYDVEKVSRQYALLGTALQVPLEDAAYAEKAQQAINTCRKNCSGAKIAIGEWLNGDPFELALSLVRYGFEVPEIFGTAGEANIAYIRKLAELSPETRVYANTNPSMLRFRKDRTPVDAAIGQDAMFYHPDKPGFRWNGEAQPFGHAGIREFFNQLNAQLQR
ncbi:MAG: oxidoreductase [Lentisphaeria bacterium]|nr:oxidoreductase [Lentisphaeria bacterium]